jgi:hypothetical protein
MGRFSAEPDPFGKTSAPETGQEEKRGFPTNSPTRTMKHDFGGVVVWQIVAPAKSTKRPAVTGARLDSAGR